ncbi:MAG: molybdopterin-dependent oxidoreductase [Deltaproteobacteria bacterium]|nr:molybdopterin-dependent oxidoreductase [Deltaproteobacteria bacterium]
MAKEVYSICFMCTQRCPIRVLVENDDVIWIEGNPHVDRGLCAKGSAGLSLLHDHERPQYPMIRTGARGAGQWRRATWDEALDYVAEKLKKIVKKHGPQSVLWGERNNLNTHIVRAFMNGLGSPNHFTHESLCRGSSLTAIGALTGYTYWPAEVGVDYANTRHLILYGRNLLESLDNMKATNSLLDSMEKGAKLTYIDPRVSVTATKADRYWMIRPGTDLALNYALIRTILKERLYDQEYVQRWVTGLAELQAFVEPYTPEWAEQETGIPAGEIVALARDAAADKPAVAFHFGYRSSHYTNDIYTRRSIIMLNALMGSIEAKGGLIFKKTPKDAGHAGVSKYSDQEFPKITHPRFDGAGEARFPIINAFHGNAQQLAPAILNEDPYPLKALIANRFDPLVSIPDSTATRQALDKLDLIVAIEVNFSQTAWYADVILPEPMYLERNDCIQTVTGLKPSLFMRRQAVTPRYDSLPAWLIIKKLAQRLGLGQYFPYETIEDIWNFQLKNLGVKIEDFNAKGFVALTDKTLLWDRKDGIKFKTPSGKIELVSSLMENAGFPSFVPYTPMPAPPAGRFRLIVGRCAAHTHISTQNNLHLNELVPENELWINAQAADRLEIKNGAYVEVASPVGVGKIKAKVTDFIHPEAVFMLHGFGKTVPAQTRCYLKGASDALLQENVSDPVGGSPGLHETMVQVRPLT